MADSQVGRYQRENDDRFAEDAPAEQFCDNCGMYKENCECPIKKEEEE